MTMVDSLIVRCETEAELIELGQRIKGDLEHYPSEWDEQSKGHVRATFQRRLGELKDG